MPTVAEHAEAASDRPLSVADKEYLALHDEIEKAYTSHMPHSLRKRYGHASNVGPMTPVEFIDVLRSHLKLDGRHILIRQESLRNHGSLDAVYVNFVNLPEDVHASKQGGGAESENNRASFWIEGFGMGGTSSGPKIRVKESNSVFRHRGGNDVYGAPRRDASHQLRMKTAAPGVIAKYLADFINKIVAEVPPNFTHTTGR